LIDLRLFRTRAFSAALATYTLGILVAFGGFLFLPQYLQLVREMSPLEAGLWTVPWSVAFVAGSMLTPMLVRRVRPAFVMAPGLVLAGLGFAVFTQVDAGTPLAVFVAGSAVWALGLAPVFTLTTDLIVGSAPPERAGAASAISETGAEFGGALGIALFGSLGVAVYRGTMADTMPAGVPPEAERTARDTLGGAVDIAAQLPDQLGIALVDAARTAFIQGMQLTAAISAVGALVIAGLVAILLRHVRAASSQEAEEAEAEAQPEPEPALAR
jgi:DHA2 family multidrug resistance protein-like MFS transporter